MPTTPTLTLCDQLVTALTTAWAPTGSDGAERHYFKRVGDADGGSLAIAGRRVVVYPTGYSDDPASRGEDDYEHRVTVDVFERFPAATTGDPTVAWIDERVDFVYTQIVEGFDFLRAAPSWNKKLRTVSTDVLVCDVAQLVGGNKLFFSRIEFVFAETRNA